MAMYKFFLEGINTRTIPVNYEEPVYVTNTSSIIDATKAFAKESKLHYAGYDLLSRGYRIYYEKTALLKRKKKTYIYFVTE
ncbi:hypothetical protein GKZ89_03220 [Bacillus mangrovi]|uniref:Uncharacterized protein n=1 Tax=Metabacillus mangrovi TaxID=1491830 RepID=A0A7X2S2B2_9BACI|nr:hypothetical protein [Metabacillus mangrovi]MTH52404.1 hypothetical protein [Metabacillus mangrovi]